jgi:hypothetical protein
MNDTSGFQERRFSIFRSPVHWFIHEQRHRFGTGSWQFLRTHDLSALFLGVTEGEKVPVLVQDSSRTPIF